MKLEEKTKKKDEQGLIIKKYQQYLKLEKSLSKNTLEAYLTDLEKLLSFLSAEGVEILEVSLTDLQRFAAGLHDIGIHARSQARIISGIKSFSKHANKTLKALNNLLFIVINLFFKFAYFTKDI